MSINKKYQKEDVKPNMFKKKIFDLCILTIVFIFLSSFIFVFNFHKDIKTAHYNEQKVIVLDNLEKTDENKVVNIASYNVFVDTGKIRDKKDVFSSDLTNLKKESIKDSAFELKKLSLFNALTLSYIILVFNITIKINIANGYLKKGNILHKFNLIVYSTYIYALVLIGFFAYKTNVMYSSNIKFLNISYNSLVAIMVFIHTLTIILKESERGNVNE